MNVVQVEGEPLVGREHFEDDQFSPRPVPPGWAGGAIAGHPYITMPLGEVSARSARFCLQTLPGES